MDGSYLSNPAVVRASRMFVCIRLATYENAKEAAMLQTVFAGRSGNLENTVYGILGPDGKLQLTRTGRSPRYAFGDSEQAPAVMAQTMERLTRRYGKKGARFDTTLALPTHANFRIALNVAACDNRPLVVGFHPEKAGLAKLEQQLRDASWHDSMVGRCEYVMVRDANELKPVRTLGEETAPGVYVIRPGLFGEFGRLLGSIPASAKPEELQEKLLALSLEFKPMKKKPQREHVRQGGQLGVKWKTAIPSTDSHAVQRRGSGRDRDRRRR